MPSPPAPPHESIFMTNNLGGVPPPPNRLVSQSNMRILRGRMMFGALDTAGPATTHCSLFDHGAETSSRPESEALLAQATRGVPGSPRWLAGTPGSQPATISRLAGWLCLCNVLGTRSGGSGKLARVRTLLVGTTRPEGAAAARAARRPRRPDSSPAGATAVPRRWRLQDDE